MTSLRINRINGATGPYDTAIPGNYGRNSFKNMVDFSAAYMEAYNAGRYKTQEEARGHIFFRFSPVGSARDTATIAANTMGYVAEQLGIQDRITGPIAFEQFFDYIVMGRKVLADKKTGPFDEEKFRKERRQYFLDMHNGLDINKDGTVTIAERACDMMIYDAPFRWLRYGMEQVLAKLPEGKAAETFKKALAEISQRAKLGRIDGACDFEEVFAFKEMENELSDKATEAYDQVFQTVMETIYNRFEMARFEA